MVRLNDDPLWYKNAIVYELHVRSFADSNGDGIGDFRGLTEKLDYLQDLGVNALWLLPFYPSPLRDDGYDIADYTGVNPIYGTLGDFKTFLREAHARGLRVITELVINHTSDQHPWFQRARRSPPGSAARDFYVWSDAPDRFKDARIIFSDFEASNWSWDTVARTYYWHRFYSHQPDLNYDNPAVHQAVLAALDFWLSLGIDGMRLDAVPYLYEREGTNCENLPETHAFLKKLRGHVDERFRNRMLLAEANQWPEDAVAYLGQGDECHMAFHFPLMPRLFMAIQSEDRFPIIDILQQTPSIPDPCQWALFLRNHDELTLEMVTDEDRDYMYRVYAQDTQARINLGIRRRLAPLLRNHRRKFELMKGLLLSLPGTPVLYYGDEIGMGDNMYLGDRNGVRTPMQWNDERNAGFSRANPQRLFLPVSIDPEYHYQTVNVEAQQNNPHSLLWWMKHIIALRKRHAAFGDGALEFLLPDNRKVLAFLRRTAAEQILVVANLSRFVQHASLDLSAFKGLVPVEMLGQSALPAIGEGHYGFTLGPYAFYWLALTPASQVGQSLPAGLQGIKVEKQEGPMELTVLGRWESIFDSTMRIQLGAALLGCIRAQAWFVGKGARPLSARIAECVWVPYRDAHAALTLVQVEYADEESRTFAMPMAFALGEEAERVQASLPRAVICKLRTHEEAGQESRGGVLYDPLGEKDFTLALLAGFVRQRRCSSRIGEVATWTAPTFERARVFARPRPEPTLLKAQESTLLGYGDRAVLKMFRSVEAGIHPEVEISQALFERTSFRNAVPVVGALEYRTEKGQATVLGALLQHVSNEGNAWQFTLDTLRRYFAQALTHGPRGEEPSVPRRPLLELMTLDPPPLVLELMGSYLESVRMIGQRTAELHIALGSIADSPDFAPEPFSMLYQRSLYQMGRTRVLQVLDLVRDREQDLPADTRDDAQRLLAKRAELLQLVHPILERRITAQRIRGHGAYRLESLLYTGKDFVVADFEGDVSRHLSNRRRKRSPLRDVAQMLQSFHMALRTALRSGDLRRQDLPLVEPWARLWYVWVAAAFARSYFDLASKSAFLPTDRDELRILLEYYLLSRGLGQLRECLVDGPDLAPTALRSVLRMLEWRQGAGG